MSNLDLKFGSVSNPPANQQQQQRSGIDSKESPVAIRSGAMSGGANPPKNLGQNVAEMTFGDIEVKPETSPKHEKHATPVRHNGGNFTPNQNPSNGGINNYYRGNHNYEHRQPRNPPGGSGYVNNNMHYNQRGPKGGAGQQQHQQQQQQPYLQPNQQMISPYNVYAAVNPFYYTPPMINQYYPQVGGASPYSSQQHPGALGDSSPKLPGSPSVHNAPLQQHRTPTKVHTPIKLSDPVTHRPIVLKSASSTRSPALTSATLSEGVLPTAVASPASIPAVATNTGASLAASSSPIPSPAPQNVSVVASGAPTASPSTGSASPATAPASSQFSIDVRNQLKEKIRQKLEEEKKQRENDDASKAAELKKDQAEKDRIEKEKVEKERLQRENVEKEKADKERLELEKIEKEKADQEQLELEKIERERFEQEKIQKEKEAQLVKEKANEEEAAAAKEVEPTFQGDTEEKIAAALASVNSQLKGSALAASQHATDENLAEKSTESTPKRPHPARNFATASRPSSDELELLIYPENIHKPTTASTQNRYKYDNEFLFQFQPVVQFPPLENWDLVRAVMDFKASFGGAGKGFSRTPSVRNLNAHNQPAMGSFGSGPGYRDRSVSGGPGGYHMGPGGHGGKGLNRINSSNNLGGRDSMGSRSGRQGSRRGKPGNERSGSNRDHHDDHNSTAAGRNPDIVAAAAAAPLKRAEHAWVPRVRTKPGEKSEETVEGEEDEGTSVTTTSDPAEISDTVRMPPDIVQRKVKSFLNKMTLDNFDRITVRIMEVAAQSKFEKDGRTLRQIIELTFAKAVDEAHWSSMYAKFCYEMTNRVDPAIEDENVPGKNGGPLFRKYLLSRCQEEFERGWSDKLPTNADGSAIDPDLESDEYYLAVTAKRRGLGLIKFIGELYMLGLLSDKIINSCIIKLCTPEDPSEEVIESLCKLMSTVGRRLDANPQFRRFVDRYMDRMMEIKDKPNMPSRLRFMLLDVADLRKNKWVDKDADKGPKTLQEIHDEAQKKEQESAKNNSRGRSFMGRSESNKSNSFNMAGDLSKIGRIRSQGVGQPTLGPTALNRDLSGSNGSRKSSSPGVPMSKESSLSSRTPSQNTRANIFEHLNDDDASEKKPESEEQESKDE